MVGFVVDGHNYVGLISSSWMTGKKKFGRNAIRVIERRYGTQREGSLRKKCPAWMVAEDKGTLNLLKQFFGVHNIVKMRDVLSKLALGQDGEESSANWH